ncbi:hypothetical protein ACA910_005660 [Epithemia clementina (nom. ined.)]
MIAARSLLYSGGSRRLALLAAAGGSSLIAVGTGKRALSSHADSNKTNKDRVNDFPDSQKNRSWIVSTTTCDAGVEQSTTSSTNPKNDLSGTSNALASSLATSSSPSSSLLIPTLEATVRAARLFSTTVGMVLDYKLADYYDYYENSSSSQSPSLSSSSKKKKEATTDNDDDDDDDDQDELEYWENEIDARRRELEEAQRLYSRSSHEHLKSYAERVEAKRHEKQAMIQAAHRLAHAEEQLALLTVSTHGTGRTSRTSRKHQRAANRLLSLCRRNGGVYIKIGQHLANLDYLLPDEYIATLSSLFDDTPRTDYHDVAAVIREELGAAPEDLFDGFEKQPMASASLAQVHVAYDKETGRKLAVKVQHRGLRESSRGDLFALVTAVRWAERTFDDFTYGWLADEIAPHLPKELDFVNEGRNAERAAEYLQRYNSDLDCVVPKILWQHTTPRVLTMEFEEGAKATDIKALREMGLRRQDVATLVSSVFASQIFSGPKGWVHCDPHPGNLLVRPSPSSNNTKKKRPQLVLLDHGLYRELDDDFRSKYAFLWKSLMLADLEGIKDSCYQLGVDKAYPLFAAVITARPFDELIERSKNKSLGHPTTPQLARSRTLSSNDQDNNHDKKNKNDTKSKTSKHNNHSDRDVSVNRADQVIMRGYAQKYMSQIFEMLGTLPRQMLLLLKLNDCLRHVDFTLGSPTNTMVVCGRYAARAVYRDAMHKNHHDTNHNRIVLWWHKVEAWWDYVQILVRIQLHDIVVWWMEQQQLLLTRIPQLSWQQATT